MKRIAALVCAGLMLAACADGSSTGVAAPGSTTSPTPVTDRSREVQVYAAVVRRLVTVDHGFGDGPSPFQHVWVVHPVENAATATDDDVADPPFDPGLRAGLKDALADLPPLDFVADADQVRDMSAEWQVQDHGVIVTLGPLEQRGATVHVQHEIWCGGTCAEWFTYVLGQRSGVWTITGDTGSRSIS